MNNYDPMAMAGAAGAMGPQDAAPMGAPTQPGAIDPALIEAMLGMRKTSEAQKAVERQRAMADKLRGSMSALNRGGQIVGNRYVGPNAGTAIAEALGGYMGGQMGQQADAQGRGIADQTAATLRQYFQAMQGGGGG